MGNDCFTEILCLFSNMISVPEHRIARIGLFTQKAHRIKSGRLSGNIIIVQLNAETEQRLCFVRYRLSNSEGFN